jgi:hypothetical protein
MNQNGLPMLVLAGGFGLWWLLAPQSVIRFYNSFYKGSEAWKNARPMKIRTIGLCWTILMIYFFFFYRRPN